MNLFRSYSLLTLIQLINTCTILQYFVTKTFKQSFKTSVVLIKVPGNLHDRETCWWITNGTVGLHQVIESWYYAFILYTQW